MTASTTPRPEPPAGAPTRPGLSGRGRVSQLPAVESLQVPVREDAGVGVRPVLAPVAPVPAPVAGDRATPSADTEAPDTAAGRRRRGGRVAAAAVVVALLAGGGVSVRQHQLGERETRRTAVLTEAEQARTEAQWISAQQQAAIRAASEVRRAAAEGEARAALLEAAQLLGSSEGRVTEESVREALGTAIAELEQLLVQGNPAGWASASSQLGQSSEAVRASVAQFEDEQEQRAAAAAAQAAAGARQSAGAGSAAGPAPGSSGGGSSSSRPQGQAGTSGSAQQAAPPAQQAAPAGRVVRIKPGAAQTGAPGWVAVSAEVTTSGPTAVSVVATVGGRSFTLAGPGVVDGTATFSGQIHDMTAGSHAWSVSAGGLVAHGSKQIGVN